jgi:enamine deaminase RidA (YjgF/YER057c/UK114 family)
MTRKLISSGSEFEKEYAYSRAVVQGDWCFVAGTTGYDYATMTISDDVATQTEQTFRNIDKALKQAGFAMSDVVRVHYLLTDAADFPSCQPILKKWFGDVRPAGTMLVTGLIDDLMKIEIEVTALKALTKKGGAFQRPPF